MSESYAKLFAHGRVAAVGIVGNEYMQWGEKRENEGRKEGVLKEAVNRERGKGEREKETAAFLFLFARELGVFLFFSIFFFSFWVSLDCGWTEKTRRKFKHVRCCV